MELKKKGFWLTVLVLLSVQLNAQKVDSVLFLGNSYTYTHDLPGTLKQLAASAGKSMFIDSYTPGGKQLSQHYSDATSQAKVYSHQWDYVVLQEQSQMPYVYPNTTYSYLNSIINNWVLDNYECTEPIIYMTWARQEGEAWLQSTGKTHDEMATYYEEYYEDMYKYVSSRISAVGAAFHQATRQGINIYSGDGSHQNADGTYLAACVFYATIYKESPKGLSYSIASSDSITTVLQSIADSIVMPKKEFYNIEKANFDYSVTDLGNQMSIDFSELVYLYDYPPKFEWTFIGSSSTSTSAEANPSTIFFDQDIEYSVQLKITSTCAVDSITKAIDNIYYTSTEQYNASALQLYPSVSTSPAVIHIQSEATINPDDWQLFTIKGDTIPFYIEANQLHFDKMAGIYLLKNKNTGQVLKFIVQ